jgi:hypothetical protein
MADERIAGQIFLADSRHFQVFDVEDPYVESR